MEHINSDEVLERIKRYDRVYRAFVIAAIVILTVVALFVMISVLNINRRLSEQIRINSSTASEQRDQLQQNQENLSTNIKGYMRCIVLVGQPVTDASIDACLSGDQPVEGRNDR